MSSTVYVGNLPYSFTDEDLAALVKQLFPKVKLSEQGAVIGRWNKGVREGQSRGFGIVHCKDKSSAEKILELLNGASVTTEAGERVLRSSFVREAEKVVAYGGKECIAVPEVNYSKLPHRLKSNLLRDDFDIHSKDNTNLLNVAIGMSDNENNRDVASQSSAARGRRSNVRGRGRGRGGGRGGMKSSSSVATQVNN